MWAFEGFSKIELQHGAVSGVEALLRWHNPRRGLPVAINLSPRTLRDRGSADRWTC